MLAKDDWGLKFGVCILHALWQDSIDRDDVSILRGDIVLFKSVSIFFDYLLSIVISIVEIRLGSLDKWHGYCWVHLGKLLCVSQA